MPYPTSRCAVRHPLTGFYEALDPAVDYDPADPLVESYPWAFVPVETQRGVVESVAIEQATAAPGQRRARSKPAKK